MSNEPVAWLEFRENLPPLVVPRDLGTPVYTHPVDDTAIASFEHFARLVAEREREAVLDTIDELMGAERERHPMFSEGYDHALLHLKEFVSARNNK